MRIADFIQINCIHALLLAEACLLLCICIGTFASLLLARPYGCGALLIIAPF